MSQPIDVFTDWFDSCNEANARASQGRGGAAEGVASDTDAGAHGHDSFVDGVDEHDHEEDDHLAPYRGDSDNEH